MADHLTYETAVNPDWIDYNGHLREAYYGLVFSYAIDRFMDGIGIDAAYREATRGTLYTLEDHTHYLREVHADARLTVETRVLDCDAKRIHLHQTMTAAGEIRAVYENLQLHVSQAGETPGAAEMPAAIRERAEALRLPSEAVAALPRRAGAIGIRRKKG